MRGAPSAPGGTARRPRRGRLHGPARIALGCLLLLAAASLLTLPWTARLMDAQDLARALTPPPAGIGELAQTPLIDWLGRDANGRSLLVRCLYGGAVSMAFGLLAAFLAVTLGVAYGLVSGYLGGGVDGLLMRLLDVFQSLPHILLVMLLSISLQPRLQQLLPAGLDRWANFLILACAIGAVSWLTMARVIRGQVLSLRGQAFAEAARALGCSRRRILVRHLLPHLTGPILVYAALTVPSAILQESFLSFLGVGIQPPQATWGLLAADGIGGVNPIAFQWWLILFPCAFLSVTLLSLQLLADALRDALDPRARRARGGGAV